MTITATGPEAVAATTKATNTTIMNIYMIQYTWSVTTMAEVTDMNPLVLGHTSSHKATSGANTQNTPLIVAE